MVTVVRVCPALLTAWLAVRLSAWILVTALPWACSLAWWCIRFTPMALKRKKKNTCLNWLQVSGLVVLVWLSLMRVLIQQACKPVPKKWRVVTLCLVPKCGLPTAQWLMCLWFGQKTTKAKSVALCWTKAWKVCLRQKFTANSLCALR